jgi:hypothetical protein
MERPEGQAKTIRGWESGAFVKTPHGEHRKVQSKVDRALRDIRKNKARRKQTIRHSRKNLGALMECRKLSSLLHLNKNCKQRSCEL